MGDWTLFSNHGYVLLYLAGHTEARLRDVAEQVGITERAVQKIVRELQDDGYLTVNKHGRCNRYRLNARRALRHPIEAHCTVAKLVALILRSPAADAEAEPAPQAQPQVAKKERPAAPAPRAERRPQAAAERRARAKKEKEAKEERPDPLDTRQQGSLF